MNSQKQISEIQLDITNKLDLIYSSINSIKQESNRSFNLLSRYKSQNLSDGIFLKSKIEDKTFKDIEQYSSLLSKQFIPRLEQLHRKYLTLKLDIDRLSNQFKNKPNEDYGARFTIIRASLKEFEKDFCNLWEEEHFLVMNYRLDISAKDLERWSSVIEAHTVDPKTVSQTIQNIFK